MGKERGNAGILHFLCKHRGEQNCERKTEKKKQSEQGVDGLSVDKRGKKKKGKGGIEKQTQGGYPCKAREQTKRPTENDPEGRGGKAELKRNVRPGKGGSTCFPPSRGRGGGERKEKSSKRSCANQRVGLTSHCRVVVKREGEENQGREEDGGL